LLAAQAGDALPRSLRAYTPTRKNTEGTAPFGVAAAFYHNGSASNATGAYHADLAYGNILPRRGAKVKANFLAHNAREGEKRSHKRPAPLFRRRRHEEDFCHFGAVVLFFVKLNLRRFRKNKSASVLVMTFLWFFLCRISAAFR